MQHPSDSKTRPETLEQVVHPAILLVDCTDKEAENDAIAHYVLYTFIERVIAAGTNECQRTATKIYRDAETDIRFFPRDPQNETAEQASERWKQTFADYLSQTKGIPIVLVLHSETIQAISGLDTKSGVIVGAFPTDNRCDFRLLL